MKNIQVIDGAINSVYDIFQMSDDSFKIIYGENTDVAFAEDLENRKNWLEISEILEEAWCNRISKANANGIHGLLFFELMEKTILSHAKG